MDSEFIPAALPSQAYYELLANTPYSDDAMTM